MLERTGVEEVKEESMLGRTDVKEVEEESVPKRTEVVPGSRANKTVHV